MQPTGMLQLSLGARSGLDNWCAVVVAAAAAAGRTTFKCRPAWELHMVREP